MRQAGRREFSGRASTFHEDSRNHIRRRLIQAISLVLAEPNRITPKPVTGWEADLSDEQLTVGIYRHPARSAVMLGGTVDPDYLATTVNAVYSSMGFKPPTGQYTILAGFVLVSPDRHQVISLATGSKCLPANRLSGRGESVNDSHAEVLARRGALLWLFDEVGRIRDGSAGETSPWIERHPPGKYRLRDTVRIHMYISTVPCTSIESVVIVYSDHLGGDASMRFLASSQDPEMAQLKDSSPFETQSSDVPWRGRNNYHCYGVLRTKPGRADSPTTASMSCSDKIAAWNVLGLQGALGSLLFTPLYIDSIFIGEVPRDVQGVVLDDCRRAFWGRIQNLEGN